MTKANNITPMGFNVLVEIIEFENKTKGGLILMQNDEKEIRSELVKIIRHGDSSFTNCFGEKHSPVTDQPYGLIQKNAGQPFIVGEKRHRLVQSDHILGTMSEEMAVAYCSDNFNYKLNLNKE